MARTKLMALLALFAALSIASIIGVYSTHQLPTERQTTITLAVYQQTGTYDYIAELKPNTIYNQSTLRPGEGTLYIGIIDHINVTFSYKLQCSLPTNTSVEYHVNAELNSPQKWMKAFTTSETQEMLQLSNTVNPNGDAYTTFSIRPTQIKELANTIDSEIGTSSSSTFNLNIKPEIHTVAETNVGTINEFFNPTLVIQFKYATAEGNYISMDGIQHTSPGTIQRTEKVALQSTINQRFATYAMAMTSFVGLTFATWVFMRGKAAEIKPIEEIIAPREEIVIGVAGEPSYKRQEITVPMNSLEDLIKLADGLDKPVFHLKKPSKTPREKPTHVFYVLDGLTKYEYRTTASSQTAKVRPRRSLEV